MDDEEMTQGECSKFTLPKFKNQRISAIEKYVNSQSKFHSGKMCGIYSEKNYKNVMNLV